MVTDPSHTLSFVDVRFIAYNNKNPDNNNMRKADKGA